MGFTRTIIKTDEHEGCFYEIVKVERVSKWNLKQSPQKDSVLKMMISLFNGENK